MFSIVVPFTDGGAELVVPFLESLKSQLGDNEVIFVGHSTDRTYEVISGVARAYDNIKIIITHLGSSYGENVNIGVKYAKYPLIIVSNNDVIFASNFLERMLDCHDKVEHPGMIGPLSNYVIAPQMVTSPAPRDVEGINSVLTRDYVFSPIISGFCFLIERETFHNVGGFDERFRNGNEDIDLSIRLLKMGYTNYVNNFTYVYHEGSHSLPKELHGGTYNRHLLGEKIHNEKGDHRIGCYITAKCSREEFENWLDWHIDIFDVIIVIADTNNIHWNDYKSKKVYIETELIGASEGERRSRGIELARYMRVDALCNLDHDEFFESKVDRKYLQRLLDLPIPDKFAFDGRFLHLWNSNDFYREDYVPKRHTFMVKLLKGVPYSYNEDGGVFHGARLPLFSPYDYCSTNVRIIHTGYMEADVREEKRRYYEEKDPVKDLMRIGFEDYSHMVNQENMTIIPWSGDSTDYMVTLNMMAEHEDAFRLQIVLENIAPVVDSIIFRTSPERDDLAQVAERFGAKVLRSDWGDDFSEQRNLMLKHTYTQYTLYLDPDEIMSQPEELVDLINRRPDGAVFTVDTNEIFMVEGIRLFVTKGTKFDGIIHESVEQSLGDNVIRAEGDIKHQSNLLEKREMYRKMNERMMKAFPDDPRPYFDEGVRTKFDGNIVKAEELVRKAISIEPKYIAARIELVRLFTLHAFALSEQTTTMLKPGTALWRVADIYAKALEKMVNPVDKRLVLGNEQKRTYK